MPTFAEMEFNKRLALEVQKYPCLYNSNQGKGNRDRKDKAWKNVKDSMNEPEMTEGEYATKWKNLRNAFRTSIFQKEAKVPHYAFREMKFMIPHFRLGTRNSVLNPLSLQTMQEKLGSSSPLNSSQAGPSSSTSTGETRQDGSKSSLRGNLGVQGGDYKSRFESMKERMAPMSESKKQAVLNITDTAITSFEELDAQPHQDDGNASSN